MSNRNQFLDDNNIADPDQILLSIFKTTATTVTQLYKESLNQKLSNHNQFLDDNNADPDQILLSIFKTTATAVTQLYKESINQSIKSYKNGYKQCLLDLMHFTSLQQHQRNNSQTTNPGGRVALTLDELMTFYNNKQSQLNSLDENSNQSHSTMANDEIPNNNDAIENNNNINNNSINDDNNYQEINSTIENSYLESIEKPSILQPQLNEKISNPDLKANFNFPKAFTFRFNNDQLSPAFNNVNIYNPHDNMKRKLGNVNTIDFLGRTFNFNNYSNDNENEIQPPPFKRNRWRKDDRMAE